LPKKPASFVPTSPIVIYLFDIIKYIGATGIDKMHKPGVAKCNKFELQTLNFNLYNWLYGVAKKKRVLQIVISCREISGKKRKSGLFTKAGFRIICGLLTWVFR